MVIGVRLIKAPTLYDAPYSYASTISAAARFIFLAGACPLDGDGAVVGLGDVEAQAHKCMDNLVEALTAVAAALTDVVATRVLVASSERGDLASAWGVVSGRFAEHDVPSTLIGVAALGHPGQLVEIEATAGIIEDVDGERGR